MLLNYDSLFNLRPDLLNIIQPKKPYTTDWMQKQTGWSSSILNHILKRFAKNITQSYPSH